MPRAVTKMNARGCHRLDGPLRLRIELACEIRVDDVLAANGLVKPLPVEHVAFDYSGIPGRICELARVTQEERQFDVLIGQHVDGPAGDLPTGAQDQHLRHRVVPWLVAYFMCWSKKAMIFSGCRPK
jgi:hypothetical protein